MLKRYSFQFYFENYILYLIVMMFDITLMLMIDLYFQSGNLSSKNNLISKKIALLTI